MEGVGAGLFAASFEHAGRSEALESLPHADAKVAYALQLLFHFLILIAGQSLRTGARNRGLVWTGIVLAICEVLFLAGRGLMLLAALDSRPLPEVVVGFNCVSLVISGTLFITGLAAMRALNSPEGKLPSPNED